MKIVKQIKSIKSTTAMADSNECPCAKILHITSRKVKSNKTTFTNNLTNREKIHSQARHAIDIRYVKLGSTKYACKSYGQRTIHQPNFRSINNWTAVLKIRVVSLNIPCSTRVKNMTSMNNT